MVDLRKLGDFISRSVKAAESALQSGNEVEQERINALLTMANQAAKAEAEKLQSKPAQTGEQFGGQQGSFQLPPNSLMAQPSVEPAPQFPRKTQDPLGIMERLSSAASPQESQANPFTKMLENVPKRPDPEFGLPPMPGFPGDKKPGVLPLETFKPTKPQAPVQSTAEAIMSLVQKDPVPFGPTKEQVQQDRRTSTPPPKFLSKATPAQVDTSAGKAAVEGVAGAGAGISGAVNAIKAAGPQKTLAQLKAMATDQAEKDFLRRVELEVGQRPEFLTLENLAVLLLFGARGVFQKWSSDIARYESGKKGVSNRMLLEKKESRLAADKEFERENLERKMEIFAADKELQPKLRALDKRMDSIEREASRKSTVMSMSGAKPEDIDAALKEIYKQRDILQQYWNSQVGLK